MQIFASLVTFALLQELVTMALFFQRQQQQQLRTSRERGRQQRRPLFSLFSLLLLFLPCPLRRLTPLLLLGKKTRTTATAEGFARNEKRKAPSAAITKAAADIP